MSADVEALARVLMAHDIATLNDPDGDTVEDYQRDLRDEATAALGALPEMLRADGDAGDALRARLGLSYSVRDRRGRRYLVEPSTEKLA